MGKASDSAGAARADGHARKRKAAKRVLWSVCAARNADKWPKWTLYKEKTETMGFGRAEDEREIRCVGRHGGRRKAHDKHAHSADRIFPTLQGWVYRPPLSRFIVNSAQKCPSSHQNDMQPKCTMVLIRKPGMGAVGMQHFEQPFDVVFAVMGPFIAI